LRKAKIKELQPAPEPQPGPKPKITNDFDRLYDELSKLNLYNLKKRLEAGGPEFLKSLGVDRLVKVFLGFNFITIGASNLIVCEGCSRTES
jgi:hypothetical protein